MRVVLALALALALLATGLISPTPTAYAHHGMVSGPECGTYEWHGEQDYVKGRRDSLIYHVDYTVGCKHLVKSNVVAAGIGEAQSNSEQQARCQRDGKADTVAHFNYYWHTIVNHADVHVTCTRYPASAPD